MDNPQAGYAPTTQPLTAMQDAVAMLNAHMRALDALLDTLKSGWTTKRASESVEAYIAAHSQSGQAAAISLLSMGYGDGSSTSYARRSVLLRWAADFDNDLEMTIIEALHCEGRQNEIAA